MNYSYGIIAESTASSPCSNVPIHCPICPPQSDPAIWKYFMNLHFDEKHETLDLTRYERFWKLVNFERSEMKKIWANRRKITTKRTKKIPPLMILESRRARIPAMYVVSFALRKGFAWLHFEFIP
jgi:hypothetical protein